MSGRNLAAMIVLLVTLGQALEATGPEVKPAVPVFEAVPTGPGLRLTAATCTVYRSNQIGMKGSVLRSQSIPATSPLTDPAISADLATLALLKSWSLGRDQAWLLVELKATVNGQKWRWQRLVDNGPPPAVVRFIAQALFSPEAVKREEIWTAGQLESAQNLSDKGLLLSDFKVVAGHMLRTDYQYANDLLVKSLGFDAAGKLTETINFSYTMNGHIRQIGRAHV